MYIDIHFCENRMPFPDEKLGQEAPVKLREKMPKKC